MTLYQRFAEFYVAGPYLEYSRHTVEVLPPVLERYQIPDQGSLLDLACGAGIFPTAMAQKGWRVTGVDLSPDMLGFAEKNSQEGHVDVRYICTDMRRVTFANEFDLATCWFDSINYLLKLEDLLSTFQAVFAALKPGGWFLFDMNTARGLLYGWQKTDAYVQQDTLERFEVHQSSCDYDQGIASVHITGFKRQGDVWERFDEIHQEKAYSLDQVQNCLISAGFLIADTYGNLEALTPPTIKSMRVWFVAHKPPA
jgi:SAM-dependent methyltransferase